MVEDLHMLARIAPPMLVFLKLLGSYKSRISKDASLDVCAKTPHDVKHLFNCPAHPTTMTPSDLWNRPVDAIRELSYLEAGVLDWDEPDR